MDKINLAIDGFSASGKSTIGKLLAEKLNYRLIDSGLFYRYLALNHQYDDEETIIAWLKTWVFQENLLSVINNIDAQEYLASGQDAAFIAQNENIRQTINKIIQNITKDKGYIVVGRDATTNILPDAEVKIVLSADIEARVNRRLNQYNNEEFTDVWTDTIKRDAASFNLIKKAYKISKNIDTTYLELTEVVDLISTQVFNKIFRIRYGKYFRIIFIIIFIYFINIINKYNNKSI